MWVACTDHGKKLVTIVSSSVFPWKTLDKRKRNKLLWRWCLLRLKCQMTYCRVYHPYCVHSDDLKSPNCLKNNHLRYLHFLSMCIQSGHQVLEKKKKEKKKAVNRKHTAPGLQHLQFVWYTSFLFQNVVSHLKNFFGNLEVLLRVLSRERQSL